MIEKWSKSSSENLKLNSKTLNFFWKKIARLMTISLQIFWQLYRRFIGSSHFSVRNQYWFLASVFNYDLHSIHEKGDKLQKSAFSQSKNQSV